MPPSKSLYNTSREVGAWVHAFASKNIKTIIENETLKSLRARQAMLAGGQVVALEEGARRAILDAVDRMAAGALRCLACAHRGDLGDLATYDGDAHPVRPFLNRHSRSVNVQVPVVRVLGQGNWDVDSSDQPPDAGPGHQIFIPATGSKRLLSRYCATVLHPITAASCHP